MGFLTILEVSKKQSYIFKSNRLRENIGASEIIEFVTKELPQELCDDYNGNHISSGGGSSIYYFENNDDCINFSKAYSRRIIKEYPSLEFFIASLEYDPEKDIIIDKTRELFERLERKKAKRDTYSCIIDFGVSKKCSSTRLPAIYKEELSGNYYSSEAKSKIDMFNQRGKSNSQFALDIKDLGVSKNEKSYIAITHIDGNRMGKRISNLRESFRSKYNSENIKEINEQYINALNQFSTDIDKAFKTAFNKMVETVEKNRKNLEKERMELKSSVIPIRKVVLAGDDVCYITDARIALECAYIFLQELEKYKVMGEKITACAGIAIVKEKYPFFKTYELSEELCKNAKSSIEEGKIESRIDWHIVQGEYNNNLGEIRNTVYKTLDGKDLSMRPLVVSKESDSPNHYSLFRKDIEVIRTRKLPGGKIKGMLKEMKKGEAYLDTYIEINQIYNVLGAHRLNAKSGFLNGKCVLFDAIEALDYFIPFCDEEV
ncbi:Cas10/Cmr2 second palm domain-containing protein [Acetivibrio clariflavus]|uniref:Cas10/Cmr2 second palm domain-containing protein n=1 Tax=Acetivibrio clariflavus (strain DSM 19732 / NBRC 101661 / EBR45) TaxID=720554 RepID=G8LX76_ACECE|nr:hypothetical protein [Acetivibrio clariflavus]AEV68767.1 hypothetical protein Clocl_2174 [Acetivibrio clariflavus DSM 19732]